jgi:ABC-type branched-subunit amino acid transport system substrate-binding protein
VAERRETLLVAPLATDASVSEGRRYVFQTNPVIALRGELMARFAATSLLTKSASIIYEENNRLSRQMARGFREEAERRQIDIPFVLPLKRARDWSRLPTAIEADTTITDSVLASTEAVYLPMSGRNAAGKIQDALTGLERLSLAPNARVLGNAEWHDLSIEKSASAFTATYSNDFYVDTRRQAVQRFIRSYRLLTGNTPDDLSATGRRLAYTGYDVARYLLRSLRPGPGRPGPEALQTSGRFDGLGTRIDFQGGNVNQAMFFHRYRSNRLELVQ